MRVARYAINFNPNFENEIGHMVNEQMTVAVQALAVNHLHGDVDMIVTAVKQGVPSQGTHRHRSGLPARADRSASLGGVGSGDCEPTRRRRVVAPAEWLVAVFLLAAYTSSS